VKRERDPVRAPREAAGDLAGQIDALLPQTQCTRCGFEGCRPYAEAIARRQAPYNRCPPGGRPVLRALAGLLEPGALPPSLDPAFGMEVAPRVALVDEAACIGCAKCIEACPTDAIVGARKWMHTVLAADCSGCELCLPPCPVDCIAMVAAPALPAEPLDGAAIAARATRFRQLYESRLARLARDRARWRAALDARLEGCRPGREAGAGCE